MKKSTKIICSIIIFGFVVAVIILLFISKDDNNIMVSNKVNEVIEEDMALENKNIVIIKSKNNFGDNAKIQNINLIDEFIQKLSNRRDIKEKISLKIREYKVDDVYDETEIIYTPGVQNFQNENENQIICVSGDARFFKEQYGYYTIIINGNEENKKEYDALQWYLKRKTTNNNVDLILYTYLDVVEIPIICTFDLSESGYIKNINLNFHQRKDLGIKKVLNKEDTDKNIDVYTFGGDVTITIDTDMLYSLEDALKQKIITIDDILNQASTDEKYGICESGAYSDGGSIEYMYPDYTILKYNTLDGNRDLVIGFNGQIINKFNKELKKSL